MAPGTRSKFGPLMFEFEAVRKQMHCIEEKTGYIFGTFGTPRSHSAPPVAIRRPHSDSAPGELWPPCPPSLRPGDKDTLRSDWFSIYIGIWPVLKATQARETCFDRECFPVFLVHWIWNGCVGSASKCLHAGDPWIDVDSLTRVNKLRWDCTT